ncbi:MAG TPA: RIO1 family regulatory kinase/ATPase [Nitrososphaerales archaeon]|nr:RIO1 family regulatory kinase/ATPase [Nitrososphaerales archaeon]
MQSERAKIKDLTLMPYIQVLTYPRVSLREAKSRIKQLEQLGVRDLIFEGHAKVGRLGILGLGTVGIVVRAEAGGRLFALKIRRTDANRPNMEEEVRITSLANRVGVGPEVHSHSRDMILMELLESQEIADWLRGLQGKGRRDQARAMMHQLLNQCRKLDIMGIDHGQLSNLRKHAVIAEGKPWIIDFESAGVGRKPRNVTTAAQYLLVGGRLSPMMRRVLGLRDTETLKRLLSDYKSDLSDYHYAKVLEHLRLEEA